MFHPHRSTLPILLAAVLVVGCGDDEDPGPTGPMDGPTSFTLTVRNVSDGASLATPFAPGVWAVSEDEEVLFTSGAADRGEGLEGLAEDGDSEGIVTAIGAKSSTVTSGMLGSGLLMPGQSIEIPFEAEPGSRLHFGTMFVQSNDLFYSPGEAGIELFSGDAPIVGDLTSQVGLWDAGTEINEEPGVGTNQAPRQSGPDTGADEGVVQPVADGFTYPSVESNIRASVIATPAGDGANFTVTIENLPGSSTPLAPGAWAAHTGPNPLFVSGEPDAGAGLEGLAEDGSNGQLVTSLQSHAQVSSAGGFGDGPLGPGGSYEFSFSAVPGQKLSFATMFVQSNDLFYAPDEEGIDLFPGGVPLGSPGPAEVTSELGLWDAGTEINEEPGVGMYQAPRQSGPDTGPTEGVVQLVMDGFSYPSVADVIEVTISTN